MLPTRDCNPCVVLPTMNQNHIAQIPQKLGRTQSKPMDEAVDQSDVNLLVDALVQLKDNSNNEENNNSVDGSHSSSEKDDENSEYWIDENIHSQPQRNNSSHDVKIAEATLLRLESVDPPVKPKHNEYASLWEHHFNEVCRFKDQHGHLPSSREDNFLRNWLNKQRVNHKNNTLTKEKYDRLINIGFDFTPQRIRNPSQKKLLRVHEDDFEHDPSEPFDTKPKTKPKPKNGNENGNQSKAWGAQLFDQLWEGHYNELCKIKQQLGRFPTYKENEFLGHWMNKQRQKSREGTLPRDRYEKLQAIGFEFVSVQKPILKRSHEDTFQEITSSSFSDSDMSPSIVPIGSPNATSEMIWEHYFQLVRKIKMETGDLPQYDQYRELRVWLNKQRQLWKIKKLTKAQYDKLRGVGFDFAPQPRGPKKSPTMTSPYAREQVKMEDSDEEEVEEEEEEWPEEDNMYSVLPASKKAKLAALAEEEAWFQNYLDLIDFKKTYGHLNVPRRISSSNDVKANPLYMWVYTQKAHYAKRQLSAEREQMLRDIGMTF